MKFKISFSLTTDYLPWNNEEVFSTQNLRNEFLQYIPKNFLHHLPGSITILFDKEIPEQTINNFASKMIDALLDEFSCREDRKKIFLDLNVFTSEEYENLISRNQNIQPWIIYYSSDGGLGDYDEKFNTDFRGMVRCISMKNHAVAWSQAKGNFDLWLITSRKNNKDWDFDSDIGHESAHSCFAPVPFFVQSIHIKEGDLELNKVDSIENLSQDHIARLCYMYCEIAVIAIRGERRETISGLPIAERPEELKAFLNFSNLLMPEFGFNIALNEYSNSESGFIDVNSSNSIYYIGGACLKAIALISSKLDSYYFPTLNIFELANYNC